MFMNDLWRGILVLVKSAISGAAAELPEGFSIEDAEPLIMAHQIPGIAYEGAVICGVTKDNPAMQRLFQVYCRQMIRHERQMASLDALFAAFEAQQIDYLPVKGCSLKTLYPNAGMRLMTDADILIREPQYERIRGIVTEQGYTESRESDHTYVWNSDVICLELHRRLIPSTSTDYFRYMGNGWDYAQHVSGSKYTLPDEVMFVFLLLHFAKHYRDSGIGLRQAIDLWLFQDNYKLDANVLQQELKRADMVEFYENIRNLLDCWFGDRPLDAKTEYMTEYLFNSGNWGTRDRWIVGQGLRESKKDGSVKKARRKMIMRAVFPPLDTMRVRYTVLKKLPWLLPVVWVARWIDALLFRRENINNYVTQFKIASVESIDSLEASLKYVGLKYDLGDIE